MTHSHSYGAPRRSQPSRGSTKDSWITIDWGERAEPSHLHGILDQIAGMLIRDPKLVEQGRTEWQRAQKARARKKRHAAERKGSPRKNSSGSRSRGSSGRNSPSKKVTSSPAGAVGFISSLFGGAKKKQPTRPSGGTLRRAMSTPGKHHSSSGTAAVRRRATDGGRPTRPEASRRPTRR